MWASVGNTPTTSLGPSPANGIAIIANPQRQTMQTEAKNRAAKSTPGFACTVCQSTFSRLEHLQRHTTASHSAERPFPCTFCEQSFARRDVLIRHLKTCRSHPSSVGRSSAPSIPTSRRGRKRRSCDACVRSKRACSGTQPCLHCVHRRQCCGYTALRGPDTPSRDGKNESQMASSGEMKSITLTRGDDSVDDIHSFSATDERHVQSASIEPISGVSLDENFGIQSQLPTTVKDRPLMVDPASRLAFLANLTSTQGMADTFDCGTVQERMNSMQHVRSRAKVDPNLRLAINDLSMKAELAIANLQKAFSRIGETGIQPQWAPSVERACRSFFNPRALEEHLLAYFALWHPNCAIIHRATFKLRDAPATLIASMALIGACLSPVPGHREAAHLWLDPVEHWIFSDSGFSDGPLPLLLDPNTDQVIQDRLDALRAAYCMILLQSWEGTEEAKRRARRSRYTEIIGVFRSVCGNELTHGDLNIYINRAPTQASWKSFAVIEELIRTSTYIFLLDSAYAIFNNTPPRMAFREARMALTCPETCFEAETIEDWTVAMRIWAASQIGMQQTTLAQAISLLYLEHIPAREWILLQQTSCLNMFALIHLLHVQLFHMRCHPVPSSQTPLQRQALDDWKRVWTQRTVWQDIVTMSDSSSKQGFYRYAPEFWCLADHILASSEAGHLTTFDNTSSVNESLIAQLLSRYDESDMSQVHDLVSLFGNLSLDL